MPNISVIVPHYDDLARLDRCLAALHAQTVPATDYEIIVADNMSPAGREAVERVIAGRARLVIATEKGAGPARNAGVAASMPADESLAAAERHRVNLVSTSAPRSDMGRILAFTDADCVPEPEWLAAGIAALEHCDFAGGRMVVIAEHDGPRSGAEAFETVFAFDNESYVRDKGFTVTANLFCPRAVFDKVGPFHVGVSEDYDWCLRARAAGFRIGYAEHAVAGHPPRADWAALRKKWQRLNAEMFELTLQKPGGRWKWLAHTLALPLSVAAHAPRLLRSPQLADRGERARGLATLTRLRMWRFADGLSRVAGVRK